MTIKFSNKIVKKGPFEIDGVTDLHPYYIRLLAGHVKTMAELPDFSDDKKIFIFSDFGGEDSAAKFRTYSFLIISADKRPIFEEKIKLAREKFTLNLPAPKELAYKDLNHGPSKRALSEYLEAADNFLHGILVTIAIDKKIESIFVGSKLEAKITLSNIFESLNMGSWKLKEMEKVLRVCHALGIFLSVLTYSGQKLLWFCDNDSINEDGKKRTFKDLQKIFSAVLAMYTKNQYEILGFAKSFDDYSVYADYLSLVDLAAGCMHDVVMDEMHLKPFPDHQAKKQIATWLFRSSKFLLKHNICITVTGKYQWGLGVVTR